MRWSTSLIRPPDRARARPLTHGLFGIEESTVEPGTKLQGARVRHLYDWWLGAGQGGVPLKRQFDIVDHPSIIANVFLIQRLPDGQYVFRLHGEAAAQIVGTHRIDVPLDELHPVEFARVLRAYYDRILADGQPRRCTGTLVLINRKWLRIESIDCPLSSDGKQTDHIVGVIEILRDAPPGRAGPRDAPSSA